MLFQKVSRHGAATRLVVFTHKSPDIVTYLHAASLERLSDGIGLQTDRSCLGSGRNWMAA